MLENLHNYFVLFHFIDIILPEVISMNSNDFNQLKAELNVMDFTKSKTKLCRSCKKVWRRLQNSEEVSRRLQGTA